MTGRIAGSPYTWKDQEAASKRTVAMYTGPIEWEPVVRNVRDGIEEIGHFETWRDAGACYKV